MSRKQNQTRNSRGTEKREKVQQVQSLLLNYDWTSPGSTKRGISVLHWLHRGIWQNTTQWDHHKNTFEDRWKRSKSNLKHVLEIDSSNASWWINQLIFKKMKRCHKKMHIFPSRFLSLLWNYYLKPRKISRNWSRRVQRAKREIRCWNCIN